MQIAPGLHSLGDKSGGRVRSFLIDNGDGFILIDTLLSRNGHIVLDALKALGKKPGDLKRIILTHAHQSHLGGLKTLKDATGARVYSHSYEADIIAGKRKMDLPPTTGLIPIRPYRLYPYQVAFVMRLAMPPACDVDENLKDGDHIGSLTVLHSPGHTPGSLSFYWPERRALIIGDMAVTWPGPALGWPMITLDNKQNRESVGKLCDLVDAEILCVGHGDSVVRGGAETMRDLFDGRTPHPDLAKL